MLRVDCGRVNHSVNLDEPYHAADGSVIQFSAGLMHSSAGETIRCEMERLAEELEAWGSSLAGEGFNGRVGGIEGQLEGKLNDTLYLSKLTMV